jgi:hypothetical protein
MAADDPNGYDRRPIPDPTALTTEQLRRELSGLREILQARLDGMDRAVNIVNEEITHIPKNIDAAIKHLEELQDEKFKGIGLQFLERDVRTDQASKANKEALDAALLAAKELVGAQNIANSAAAVKTEVSFTKQIDQITTLIQTGQRATDATIQELKERLDRGEGAHTGIAEVRTEQRAASGNNINIGQTIIMGVSSLIALTALILTLLLHH